MNARTAGSFFGQPAGLATLFFTEAWERASYYGMRALLILFLVGDVQHGGFGLDTRTAAAIYGLYTASVYLVGLPGGWLADRWLGSQRAVLAGGVVIAVGHLILGSAHGHTLFYAGLGVIVAGTGLLKPNASALVAELYPQGGPRRDAGYTVYYMGINLGGMIGPLVTGWLAAVYGWSAGFMVAAAGMALGVAQFARGRAALGTLGHAPPRTARRSGGRAAGLAAVALGIAAMAIHLSAGTWSAPQILSLAQIAIALIALLYFGYLLWCAQLTSQQRRQIYVAAILFIASVLFWAGYEQAGSSLNLFAQRYTRLSLFGAQLPAATLQSLDSIFVIAFAPVLSALWITLGRRRLDPSRPVKFMFGLSGVALGFLVMAWAARYVVRGQQVGVGWLMLTYLLHTWGELCLSPIGMSAFSQLLPPRMAGQGLGLWFVSLSLGDLLASRIAAGFDPTQVAALPGQFLLTFWPVAASAVALVLLLPLMRRWGGDAL